MACSKNNSDRIKIVDANGEPVKLNRIVPEFNEQQMQKQKEALSSNNQNGSNIKFVNGNFNIMQQVNDPNFITPKNTFPDEDIFADRITNFNYVENNKKQTPKILDGNANNNIDNINDKKNIVDDNSSKIKENKNDIKDLKSNEIKKEKVAKNTIIENSVKNEEKNNTEIDINEIKDNKPITENKIKTNVANKNKSNKMFYIQLGIFGEKSNAEATYSRYSKISNGMIENYLHKGKNRFKVLLGPYTDKKLAEIDMEKVIKTGHYDVYITEKK